MKTNLLKSLKSKEVKIGAIQGKHREVFLSSFCFFCRLVDIFCCSDGCIRKNR